MRSEAEKDVGIVIRELRTALGMTQEEFAHALAVTFSTVNRWENGHAKPSKLAWKAIEAMAQRRGRAPDGRDGGEGVTPAGLGD